MAAKKPGPAARKPGTRKAKGAARRAEPTSPRTGRPDIKDDARRRLARVAGQIEGVRRMIDEEKYCVDILIQIAAARAALDRVGLVVLQGHVEECLARALAEGKGEEYIQEVREAMGKFLR